MELWIPITIAAAFLQNIRSMLQKHLRGRLSTSGATFSRFVFGIPFAIIPLIYLINFGGYELPVPNARFAIFAALAGLLQIMATAFLIYSFSFRNFAAGTTFSKTETVQAAMFGVVVLGDRITAGAGIAINA